MKLKRKIWAALTAMTMAFTAAAPIAVYADEEAADIAAEAVIEEPTEVEETVIEETTEEEIVIEEEPTMELFDEAATSLPTADSDGVITLTANTNLTLADTLDLGTGYINAGEYSLTITGGTITGSGTYAIYTTTGEVTLDGVTVTVTPSATDLTGDINYYGIYSETSGAVTLQNNSIISLAPTATFSKTAKKLKAYGIYSNGTGEISVNGGTITVSPTASAGTYKQTQAHAYGIYSASTGDVSVSCTKITGNPTAESTHSSAQKYTYAYGIWANADGDVTMTTDSTIEFSSINNEARGVYSKTGDITIKDSTISITDSAATMYGVYNGNTGESGYKTTITDSTISVSSTSKVTYGVHIYGSADVVIDNSKIKAETSASTVHAYAVYLMSSDSSLTIKGDDSYIYASTDATTSTGGAPYAIWAASNSTVAIEGGTIDAESIVKSYGIYVKDNSTVNISDGTITASEGIYTGSECTVYVSSGTIDSSDYAIDLGSDSSLTISGGDISSDYSAINATTGTITISSDDSDTTISSGTHYTVEVTTATITVKESGAEITSESGADVFFVTTGEITLYGGTYSSDVLAYVAENSYQTTETEEGDTVYIVNSVGDDLADESGDDGPTTTTAPNETSTTTESDDGSGSNTETSTVSIITGNDVTKAYSEQATAEVASIKETESNVSSITTKRVDTVTDYGYDSDTGKYTTDVEPLIEYTITYSDSSTNTYTEELDLSGKEASVKFTVPSGATDWTEGATVTAMHTYGGDVEYLTANVVDGTLTYTTINGFSNWVLSLTSTASDASAQSITITYSEYEDDQGNVVPGKYYINVKGSDIIYRFMAAQLAFELETDDAIGYEIEPTEYVNMTTAEYTNGSDTYTVYEFNMDGTNVSSQTADSGDDYTYAIGIVTFSGVGTGTFGVNADYGDNMVQAAVYNHDSTMGSTPNPDNNIVKTYTVGGTASSTSGALNENAALAVNLNLATTELTVNVMFPNVVNEQDADYTKMSLEYNNVMLTEAETVEIGSDTATYGTVGDAPMSGDEWTGYQFTITVPTDYATTLKFTGDGYRTYNTSIVPTAETATVTVWNNVMDSDETVVISNDDADTGVMTAVTFLAGEIVADNEINLYDLSAVVSYFGKTELTADDTDYIKYDLNRDNKIDSKDIAMVLVSWGK